MCLLEIRDCENKEVAKELIREYATIKGAEQCFVSLDKELADLDAYYEGGALLIGYDHANPVATIAIRKVDDTACEIKRLYVKPDYRGKGYARKLIEAILERAKRLGLRGYSRHEDAIQVYIKIARKKNFSWLSFRRATVSF